MKNIRELKSVLRQKYRAIRSSMTEEEKEVCSRKILARLTSLYQYRNAAVIITYVSKNPEVDTWQLIQRAFSDGKKVAVPKCRERHEMDFYLITSQDDLEIGAFGVFEPKPESCQRLCEFADCFCIVPGMAFDTAGYRLGYGGGYYDRFLSEFPGATAGLCYSKCVKWNLPKSCHDRPVNVLVTDKYFRRCTMRSENI